MHIGCTGGLLGEKNEEIYKKEYDKDLDTHHLISKVSNKLAGIDISKSKIEFMRMNGFKDLYIEDICDPNFNHGKKYQVILFPNIIEHLDNVGLALTNIKKMMDKNSKLIITTNNAFDIVVIIKLLFNYESVHPEHTSYFSYLTMKRVLFMNQYKIEKFYYANNEKHISFLKKPIQFFFKYFRNLFCYFFKQYSANIIFVCKLD